ncbi:hypothetical protein GF342_04240 [Candidatus Woesearchaeota archaeon]|nr:hypothetical protein [Candidatus Woesearchaeota archaeon]
MKKGQIEIMGLLLIILLIGVFILFSILYTGSDDDPTQVSRETVLARSTILNLLQTHTDCSPQATIPPTVQELLEDCATGATMNCPGGNSCQRAHHIIDRTLKTTFRDVDQQVEGVIARDYSFHIANIGYFDNLGGATSGLDACPRGSRQEGAVQTLPISASYKMELTLLLCISR